MTMQDDDFDELTVHEPEPDPATGEIQGMRCQAQKADGSGQCRVRALPGTSLCVHHSPEYEADRAYGRSISGRRPTLKRLPGMGGEVKTAEDVLRICNVMLKTLMERDAEASSIAAISRVLALCLDTLSGIEMERRVSALEDKANALEG